MAICKSAWSFSISSLLASLQYCILLLQFHSQSILSKPPISSISICKHNNHIVTSKESKYKILKQSFSNIQSTAQILCMFISSCSWKMEGGIRGGGKGGGVLKEKQIWFSYLVVERSHYWGWKQCVLLAIRQHGKCCILSSPFLFFILLYSIVG